MKMSQKVKCIFKFEVSDSWKAGEPACWTECPFSPLIELGHTCKFLTTKGFKCPFRDNKFKTSILGNRQLKNCNSLEPFKEGQL